MHIRKKTSTLIKPSYELYWMLFVVFLFQNGKAQGHIHISDNAFINISNGGFLVLDNNEVDALVTSGSGGNILSEGEDNKIRWYVGSNTGTYTIPWTTPSLVRIPLEMDVIVSGDSNGYIDFSTWDNNLERPSDVTNMAGNGEFNNSSLLIDRFWIIDQQSYSDTPSVVLSFGYDENEQIPVGNSIIQGEMLAQRFDEVNDSWESIASMGDDNYPVLTVSNVFVDNTNWFRSWTLESQSNLFPIELAFFSVEVTKNNEVLLQWQTTSNEVI